MAEDQNQDVAYSSKVPLRLQLERSLQDLAGQFCIYYYTGELYHCSYKQWLRNQHSSSFFFLVIIIYVMSPQLDNLTD